MRRLLALLFLALSTSASAQTIVDQEFPGWATVGYYLDYPGDTMAQTFTLRHAGRLVEVDIRVGLDGDQPPIDDLTVKLVRTDAQGAPLIDDVLASRRFA